jgi:hypothetical protein
LIEGEIIISEIVFGMVHGRPYEGFPKKKKKTPHLSPIYQFQLPITHHWN